MVAKLIESIIAAMSCDIEEYNSDTNLRIAVVIIEHSFLLLLLCRRFSTIIIKP